MQTKTVLVVGDKFASFAAGKDAMTLSQLRGLLSLPKELVLDRTRIVLVPGQGLSDEDVVEIAERAAHSPIRAICDFSRWHRRFPRAPQELSHKKSSCNTLVSVPRQIGNDIFEIDMMVDEDCELMGDHQTGQHLQGMLIVEAARQGFLAVTEKYMLSEDALAEKYFIFESLDVAYKKFIFPIPATLICTVDQREKKANGHHFTMHIDAYQTGELVAVISVTFSAVKYRSMARIESALATASLGRFIAEIPAQGGDPAHTEALAS